MNPNTPSDIDEHDLERDNSKKEALDKSIRSSALGCAQFSLEQEYRREESCITQSGLTITGLSAFSIFFITAFPPISNANIFSNGYLLTCYFFISSLLLSSLATAALVLFRPKINYPASPKELHDYFMGNKEEFNLDGLVDSECSLYEELWESADKANQRRIRLLHVSLGLFLLSVVAFLIAVTIPGFYFSASPR